MDSTDIKGHNHDRDVAGSTWPAGHLATNPNPALTWEPAGFASLLADSVTNASRRTYLFIYLPGPQVHGQPPTAGGQPGAGPAPSAPRSPGGGPVTSQAASQSGSRPASRPAGHQPRHPAGHAARDAAPGVQPSGVLLAGVAHRRETI